MTPTACKFQITEAQTPSSSWLWLRGLLPDRHSRNIPKMTGRLPTKTPESPQLALINAEEQQQKQRWRAALVESNPDWKWLRTSVNNATQAQAQIEWPTTTGHLPNNPEPPPSKGHLKEHCKPCQDSHNTCRLIGKSPMPLAVNSWGYGPNPRFHSQDQNWIGFSWINLTLADWNLKRRRLKWSYVIPCSLIMTILSKYSGASRQTFRRVEELVFE